MLFFSFGLFCATSSIQRSFSTAGAGSDEGEDPFEVDWDGQGWLRSPSVSVSMLFELIAPFSFVLRRQFFGRAEVKDLMAYLQLVENPFHTVRDYLVDDFAKYNEEEEEADAPLFSALVRTSRQRPEPRIRISSELFTAPFPPS